MAGCSILTRLWAFIGVTRSYLSHLLLYTLHVQMDLRLHFTSKFLHIFVKECVCIKDPPTPEVRSLTGTANELHTQEQSGKERATLFVHAHDYS